jgi:PAS domain S-box-containing protein
MSYNRASKKPRAKRAADHAPLSTRGASSEIPFGAMVELAPDAFVVTDPQGHITLVNRQTEMLFSYPRADLLGQPIEILLAERFRAAYRAHRAASLADPRTLLTGTYLRGWGRRRDGSEFPVAVGLSALPASEENSPFVLVSTMRAVTEYMQQVHTESASEELRQLRAITETALAYPRLDDLLNVVLDRLQKVLALDNAAILLLEETEGRLVVRAARGPEAGAVGRVHVPVGKGFAGRIAATRVPLAVEDLSDYPVVNPMLREQLTSVLGVPLEVEGRLVGVLHIGSAGPRHYTEKDLQLLLLVGQRIGLALDHARVAAAERRAHVEAEARAAELEATFAALADGLVVFDAEGRTTHTNPAFQRMIGSEEDRANLSLPIQDYAQRVQLRHPDGHVMTPEEWPSSRLLRGKLEPTDAAVDIVMTSLTGRELTLSVSGASIRDSAGRIVGGVMVYRDVTERRRAETTMRFQSSLLERTHDAIFAWEAGGPIIYWNHGAELLYSYPAAEALGQVSHDLLRTVHPMMSRQEFEAMLLREGEWTGELTHKARDGSMIDVLSRHQVLREPNGRVYILETSHDITARKRLEREREELVSLVAHDLANPLTSVKAWVQLLQRQLADGKRLLPDALDALSQAVARLERLISDLRLTESLEAGHFTLELEPYDLVALCRDTAEAVCLSSRRVVSLMLPDEPVLATIDRDRIGQVLANLLANALKYSPADQPVELTLATEEVPFEPDTGRMPETCRTARIAVRDAGQGIPTEALAHLFERHYRVPGIDVQYGQSRGLGLGLYIARELVLRHGGRIGVESGVGEGSTFWFTLPLAPLQN